MPTKAITQMAICHECCFNGRASLSAVARIRPGSGGRDAAEGAAHGFDLGELARTAWRARAR